MGDSDPDPAEESDSAGQPDPVRQEAERLVATALGVIRLAVASAGSVTGTDGGSTHAAECAFCPFCRTIAILRDPDPEFAERLATAAGDFATGLTGLLRVFSTAAGDRPAGGPPTAEPHPTPTAADEVWREATRCGHDSWPAPKRDVPVTATGAGAEAQPGGAVPPADAAGCARVPQPSVSPEPAGAESAARHATRRRVSASHAAHPVAGATDDDPGRRD